MSNIIPQNENSIAAKLYVTANSTANRNFVTLWSLLSSTRTEDGKLFLSQVLDTVNGNGFTLFAPTDQAFQDANNSLMRDKGISLSDLKVEDVRKTLLYHVLEGLIMSTGLRDGATPTTLSGKNLCVSIKEMGNMKQYFVNGAQVVSPNIKCTNGVIHVIDKVLMPVDECDRDFLLSKRSDKKKY